MDEVHHTEADGLEATWRSTRDETIGIEIMEVHNTSGDVEVRFAPGTDLVAARESCPAWDRLWDKIRDEFWAHPSASNSRAVRWWD